MIRMKNKNEYILFQEEALQQHVYDVGHHFTTDIQEAMFMWPNGAMTSSSEMGVRGDDHNILRSYFDCVGLESEADGLKRQEMFEVAASLAGTIILVPESQVALKASNQELTDEQKQVLQGSEFQIQEFSQGITKKAALEKLNLDEDGLNQWKNMDKEWVR